MSENYEKMAEEYFKFSDDEKRNFIEHAYNNLKWSVRHIADLAGTYPNKIKRDAKRLEVNLDKRDASESQKLALESGRHPHPTKGTSHGEETKNKIGKSVSKTWNSFSPDRVKQIKKTHKKNWENRTEAEKEAFKKMGNEAIREAAKNGSKLERFIYGKIVKMGFIAEYHKKHMVKNDQLHLDIFIPALNTIIEVDGPSHFNPIWGEKVLERNRKSDSQKNGLLLGMGYVVIRLQQRKSSLSEVYKKELWEKLEKVLNSINEQFPKREDRFIVIK